MLSSGSRRFWRLMSSLARLLLVVCSRSTYSLGPLQMELPFTLSESFRRFLRQLRRRGRRPNPGHHNKF